MQFFLYDFALALAALLGYRALEAITLHRSALTLVPPRLIAGPGPSAPPQETGCGSSHRLINFW
jgi:hypothetical protein